MKDLLCRGIVTRRSAGADLRACLSFLQIQWRSYRQKNSLRRLRRYCALIAECVIVTHIPLNLPGLFYCHGHISASNIVGHLWSVTQTLNSCHRRKPQSNPQIRKCGWHSCRARPACRSQKSKVWGVYGLYISMGIPRGMHGWIGLTGCLSWKCTEAGYFVKMDREY